LPLETVPLLEIKTFFFALREWGYVWVGGRVCTRWVCLDIIPENMKIYSYLLVIKNPYPQDDSRRADKLSVCTLEFL
jgi:hypothetical protein